MSKQTLKTAVISGLFLFAMFFLSFIPTHSTQNSPALLVGNATALSGQEQASAELLPVRVRIPAIQVDSGVVPVGLTSKGAIDVPKDPAEVAWFNLGSYPGDTGTAVIAGHYGWKNGLPAVFDNLHKLRKDDKIFVENNKGETITFVVREIRTYNKNATVPGIFSSNDGKAHLNLITCTGDWNKAEETFSNRLVVFTDKE